MAKGRKNASQSKIEVHGTYDGKLFIYSSDLFSLKKVQDLIEKVKNSNVLSEADRVELKGQ